MVEGFVLPEVLAGAAENGIGFAGGYSFQAMGYAGKRDYWGDQHVDVVWHDHIGVERVEIQILCSEMYGGCDAAGDGGIFQPEWARAGSVQDGIHLLEPFS